MQKIQEKRKLPREQIPLSCNLCLLGCPQLLDVRNNLKGGIFRLQSFLFCFWLLSLFAERARKDVLEGGGVQEVANLLLAEGLLDQQAEEHSIAKLPEVVEQLGPGVGVLHDVQQLVLIVLQDSRGAVVVSWQLAIFWHRLHEGPGELEDVPLYQTLHHLQQLLHDNSNTLITQEFGHAVEVDRPNKVAVLPKNRGIGNVQGLKIF